MVREKYPKFWRCIRNCIESGEVIDQKIGYIFDLIKEENVDSNAVKEFLLHRLDSVGKGGESLVGSCLYSTDHFDELLNYLSDKDRKKFLTELLKKNPNDFFSKIKVLYIKEIYDALSLSDYQELFKIL